MFISLIRGQFWKIINIKSNAKRRFNNCKFNKYIFLYKKKANKSTLFIKDNRVK